MKRINLNCNNKPHFIGSWVLEDKSLNLDIINFFEENSSTQKYGKVNIKDSEIKKSTDMLIMPKDLDKPNYWMLKKYIDNLYDCYLDYISLWPFLGKMVKNIDIGAFNIQKYETGGHFSGTHTERNSIKNMHRILVFMTYLNDVESGGETNFPNYELTIKPEQGKTIIWPAEWTHEHSGNIVKLGSKYIITGWMHFPVSL